MTYVRDESGAVTVDWVVLTAGLVGLGLATMTVVSQGTQDVSEDVEAQLGNRMIATSFAQFSYPDLYDNTLAAYASLEGTTLLGADTMLGSYGSFLQGSEKHIEYQAKQLEEMNSYPNLYITARADDVTRYNSLAALDPNTASASDIATIIGRTETQVQDDIDNHAGGDFETYLNAQVSTHKMRSDEYDAGMARANELGLI